METNVKLRLNVININSRIIDTINAEAFLDRSTNMPYITVDESVIRLLHPYYKDYEGEPKKLAFYDYNNDYFQFYADNIATILDEEGPLPEEITITLIKEGDNTRVIEPGLWKKDKDGKIYRMCDNAFLHLIYENHLSKEAIKAASDWIPTRDKFSKAFKHEFSHTYIEYISNNVNI